MAGEPLAYAYDRRRRFISEVIIKHVPQGEATRTAVNQMLDELNDRLGPLIKREWRTSPYGDRATNEVFVKYRYNWHKNNHVHSSVVMVLIL